MKKLSFIAMSLLAVTGCRESNSDKPDSRLVDAKGSGATKVTDVQNDSMAPGTPVSLKGVVVTAIDKYGARTGNFWVADPEGGPFSGVLVFGAPADQVGALAVGDIVEVSGAEKAEFALADDMTGRKTTELVPVANGQITVTKTGTGSAPAPVAVDAAAIAALATPAERDAEWEKWEGVLIKISNVAALNNPRVVGSSDPTFFDFTVTSGVRVDSSLAALPMPEIKTDDCLASVTGMGDYFFNYKILPRETAEIVTGGTACPPKEEGALCMDNMDNDLDGFKDCADFSCQGDPTSGCQTAATVADVQTGVATGTIKLTGVYVTAIDAFGNANTARGLWVADNLAAAENQGVYVFTRTAPTVAVGDRVDVLGTVTEFDPMMPAGGNTITEITSPTVTLVTAATTAPTPLVSTPAVAGDATTGEPFEGVLVTFNQVKVTAINGSGGTASMTVAGNGTDGSIIVGVESFRYTLGAMGNCYNITGVMHHNFGAETRNINPRSDADLVSTTGCN